jgi:hypothetical protein
MWENVTRGSHHKLAVSEVSDRREIKFCCLRLIGRCRRACESHERHRQANILPNMWHISLVLSGTWMQAGNVMAKVTILAYRIFYLFIYFLK